jgi:hypothetical protein
MTRIYFGFRNECQEFAPPAISGKASRRTIMASKADFTPDEWTQIVGSPMVAGMAITAADPGGLWSLLQEGIAGGRSLLDAKQDAAANPLVKAVAEDMTNADTRTAVRDAAQSKFKGVQIADLKVRAVNELRSVAALVDAKAPIDAPGFKTWLSSVAQRTAEAGKEGGFLGFGGVAVSDAERATIAQIAAALGITSV